METNLRYIPTIMERAICEKHGGSPSGPCYTIERGNGDLLLGVCGTRAKKAGMVGRIHPSSLQLGKSGSGNAKR